MLLLTFPPSTYTIFPWLLLLGVVDSEDTFHLCNEYFSILLIYLHSSITIFPLQWLEIHSELFNTLALYIPNFSLSVICWVLLIFFQNKPYFFRAVLGLHQNRVDGTKISHIAPTPAHAEPLLLPVSSTTVMIHWLQLMNLHWHINITPNPQFNVYSWCCTFYGFGQIYSDMYLPLEYHTE